MEIDEPLPSIDDLTRLVAETFESAGVPAPDDATVSKAIDTLVGLPAFPAEQDVDGLSQSERWDNSSGTISDDDAARSRDSDSVGRLGHKKRTFTRSEDG